MGYINGVYYFFLIKMMNYNNYIVLLYCFDGMVIAA
jgi:hypothetical protein